MNILRWMADTYGDARGYGRSRIRRDVRLNAGRTPEAMAELSANLFRQRVAAAVARFPPYAAKVDAFRGRCPGPDEPIQPAELPVWRRSDQRALFASLQEPPVAGAFIHATGGSTGEPTRFYVTRASYEWRMAVSDRGYGWAGAEEGRKSYYVWGSPIKPLPVWMKARVALQHALQRREYFDSFVFNDERKAACCRAINRFRPPVLVGYAGNLVELALFVRQHPGVLRWKARTLVTAAEGLRPGQRELLEETVTDEVFMSYGSREFMLIGMECPVHRGYHVSSDMLRVEVVDDSGRPLPAGDVGRIVVTDLRNEANPFVRYEIGDWGTLAPEPCPCGLPFPLLASVEGRTQEYLLAADGSRQTALFIPHLMKEFRSIRGYQVEQDAPGCVRVCLLADHDLPPRETEDLSAVLRSKLGSTTQVVVTRVTALRKSASGKVPIVLHGPAQPS